MPLDTSGGTAAYTEQSPTLLASQPLSAPETKEPGYWEPLYQHLERRLAALRAWRWSWWSVWMVLAAFFLPRRAKAWVVANNYNRGDWLNQNIVDGTGSLAALTCASGMWSGLTNPARPWFTFAPAIEGAELDQEAKDWFVDTQNKVMAVLHQSNFYSTMAQFFQDVVVFGTSPVIIYEDDETVIRCFLPCAGEYFLAAGSRLTVDTLYREFTMTVAQMVEMFTLEECPQQVQALWEQGRVDQEYLVAHAIEPNFAISAQKKRGQKLSFLPGRFTWREVYWLRGQKDRKPLSIRGFYDQPFMAGRWTTVSNDPYGRGPGMDALGDQKQVQQETRRKAEFIEKGVRPPMVADPALKNEPASILPGMVTFVNTANGKKAFEPAFEVQAIWLQHLTADIAQVNARIDKCFYVPQFMAITTMQGVQPRNELELTKRDLERLQMLGPVIDSFENDVASPAIQRVVSIMQKRGMIKPMPASLHGMPLKIVYVSLMRMAQQSAESVALKDFAASIGTASLAAKNAGVPDPARKVNWDRWSDHLAATTHVPRDIIFTDDEVKEHDQARMAALEKDKQTQINSSLAKPAVDAAKVLSQTPVDGGSMLHHLLTGDTTPQ